jgi:hypothetical protein
MGEDGMGEGEGEGEDMEMVHAANRDLARVGMDSPTKKQRSPYVKWSKEEDDLLTQVRSYRSSL